ncbi:MAG: hypothetical protein VYC39_07180 [Myxococcota bacterium]|nr:hypothetical protein [Myxococcota bacterium]
MIEAPSAAFYDVGALRELVDPIPEVEELIEIGLDAAQDDDLLSLLGKLSAQTNAVPEHDSILWLSLYRHALKLADLIRPIQTQDQAPPRTISEPEQLELRQNLDRMEQKLREHYQFAQRRLRPRLHEVVTQGIIADLQKRSFDYNIEGGQGRLLVTKENTKKLEDQFLARMNSFSDHYIDQIEIGIAEIYRNGLASFRRVFSHETVKRPRMLRCKRPNYQYEVGTANLSFTISEEPKTWLSFQRKSSACDAMVGKALVEHYSTSLKEQQEQHASALNTVIDEFVGGLFAAFEIWSARMRNRISLQYDRQGRKERPQTIGVELERNIIPAIEKRIKVLELSPVLQESREAC